jgi:predicted short-subunit dehydrogenase-like oxidoreductase (DUF2520 family)
MSSGLTIIGAGRLGGALAIAFSRCGMRVENLVLRKRENAKAILDSLTSRTQILEESQFDSINSNLILIATQDSKVRDVAEKLRAELAAPAIVAHCSGAFSSSAIEVLREIGCAVGSFHPLVSVSDPIAGAKSFAGTYFCVEGDGKAVVQLKALAEKLGGNVFSIPENRRSLYHAAAVTTAGHIVALFSVACEMLEKCGVDQIEAKKILLPLLKSTVRNIESLPLEKALTGTFARGDLETLQRHLAALRENLPAEYSELYLRLGEISTNLAMGRREVSGEMKDFREFLEREIIAGRRT